MGIALVTSVLLTVIAIAVVVWLTSVTDWWLPFFVVAFAVAGFQADKRRRRTRSRAGVRRSGRRSNAAWRRSSRASWRSAASPPHASRSMPGGV